MKAIIEIEALKIEKNEHGRLFLYPSILSIRAHEKEDILKIIEIFDNKLNLDIDQHYVSYNAKGDEYKVSFEGKSDISWTLEIAKLLKRLTLKKYSVALVVNKSKLCKNINTCDIEVDSRCISKYTKDILARLYINTLVELLSAEDVGEVLKLKTKVDKVRTRVKVECSNKIYVDNLE